MKSFNVSVKAKLFATLVISAIGMVVVGALGWSGTKSSNADLDAIFSNRFMPTGWVGTVETHAREVLRVTEDVVIRQEAGEARSAMDTLSSRSGEVKTLMARLQATDLTDKERALVNEFSRNQEQVFAAVNESLVAAQGGNFSKAESEVLEKARPAYERMTAAGDELLATQIAVAQEMRTSAEKNFKRNSALTIGAIVLGTGVAGFMLFVLINSIVGVLKAAVKIADRIAGGELGNEVRVESNDELGQLLDSLRRMDAKLVEIVGGVRSSADAVGAAASQLSRGNDDLSQRTQEQAAALEETASSMEEMTATVKQNADNARQANQLAVGAREQAEKGGSVVQRAIGAMGEINASSRKIADIISVIDEIAFQTNLLALNAAVEAARAGEQGRGFAVVATEVRNLAQRSASAAKEIKDLINDSVDKVKVGSELVDESGKTLAEIMESVKKVTDIVAEIAAASEEQSAGIEQVNNAVSQMDNVTQQNAALVEEASAASKAMEQQSAMLLSQIAFFRTAHGGAIVREVPRMTEARRVAPAPKPAQKPASARVTPAPRTAAPSPVPLARASGDDSVWQEF
jgi:methyl-accepting chemotaxis protein